MSEPRRSTRARAREEAAPAPEAPKETPVKGAKATLKRKRPSLAVKDATSSTPTTEAALQGPRHTLPLRILPGQPLPTLPEPQPLELPASEWQNIQQSGVLSASMEQSRAVWISGVNFRVFHKFFTQPKKTADRTDEDRARTLRQRDLFKNFPELGKGPILKDPSTGKDKETSEVQAQLVIEPHTFPIRLYAPREGVKQASKKAPPAPSTPSSSAPTYGSWPNHSQSQPNNHHGQPVYQQKQAQPRPPPPKPVQKTPLPGPGPASAPAPDPVIHMLAARAGTDPELKAVMKVVAAGQASKDQLEFFQTHISELTAILARQKESSAKGQKTLPPPSPAPKSLPPPPAPKVLPPPMLQPTAAPPPPPPRPVQPVQLQHTPQNAPTFPNSYHQHQQQYYPPRQMSYTAPSQPTGYRPLVFSFEEGNGDLLYFPSYSFMEWLPNTSGAKLSFLITKLKPRPDTDAGLKHLSTPASKTINAPPPGFATHTTPSALFANSPNTTPYPGTPVSAVHTPLNSFIPQPRIEDFDEHYDIANIDFYQPITVLLLSDNQDIRSGLPRAIRPADVVEKYMDTVFDNCKRAEETYLAFKLPKDKDADGAEKRVRSGDGTPVVATPSQDAGFGGSQGLGLTLAGLEKKKAGRPRKSLV